MRVAVLGRATHLLTSFDARPGDVLVAAFDLRGAFYEPYAYWNCSTGAPPERLRGDLDILPQLAADGLCRAAKDVSMGGVLGTLLMLMECSRVGATIDLAAIPRPPGAELERWLSGFPSYGYLLAVPREHVAAVRRRFARRDIACAAFGECTRGSALIVNWDGARQRFWDLRAAAFTGVRTAAAS
jgi:selenophosphate synthetase-related protein